MARKDPKFVRLHSRLISGCLGDVDGSDWFIGGRDVKPFPSDDEPMAQAFVRRHLQNGNLEEASKSESDAVEEAGSTMRQMHSQQLNEREEHDRAGHQEAQLVGLANKTTTKLDRLRAAGASDDEDEEEDTYQAGLGTTESGRRTGRTVRGGTATPTNP